MAAGDENTDPHACRAAHFTAASPALIFVLESEGTLGETQAP